MSSSCHVWPMVNKKYTKSGMMEQKSDWHDRNLVTCAVTGDFTLPETRCLSWRFRPSLLLLLLPTGAAGEVIPPPRPGHRTIAVWNSVSMFFLQKWNIGDQPTKYDPSTLRSRRYWTRQWHPCLTVSNTSPYLRFGTTGSSGKAVEADRPPF